MTRNLGYQWPVPFLGYILTFEEILVFDLFFMWKIFPEEYRKNEEFKKRMKMYCNYVFLKLSMILIYQMISEVIGMTSVDYQPFVALALPLTREIFLWSGMKIAARCSNGDEKSANVFVKYSMTTIHALTLCYTIGSVTTARTSWVLMGIDFSINIIISFRIVWNKKFESSNL